MSTIHPLKIDLLKIPGAKKFQSKDGTWHVAIPHPAVYIGEKGAYLDCDLSEKKNGKDNYDNTHSIAMRQSKEQRQAKEPRVFIGDGKTLTFGNSQQSAPAKKDDTWIDSTDDGLEVPF
jgi:hypothetical protein